MVGTTLFLSHNGSNTSKGPEFSLLNREGWRFLPLLEWWELTRWPLFNRIKRWKEWFWISMDIHLKLCFGVWIKYTFCCIFVLPNVRMKGNVSFLWIKKMNFNELRRLVPYSNVNRYPFKLWVQKSVVNKWTQI